MYLVSLYIWKISSLRWLIRIIYPHMKIGKYTLTYTGILVSWNTFIPSRLPPLSASLNTSEIFTILERYTREGVSWNGWIRGTGVRGYTQPHPPPCARVGPFYQHHIHPWSCQFYPGGWRFLPFPWWGYWHLWYNYSSKTLRKRSSGIRPKNKTWFSYDSSTDWNGMYQTSTTAEIISYFWDPLLSSCRLSLVPRMTYPTQ